MFAKRITWAELARLTGQSRQNLYFKKGRAKRGLACNQATTYQIADALGVKPEEIAERIG